MDACVHQDLETPYRDNGRLYEILKILIENGANTRYIQCTRPETDYIIDAFLQTKERHPGVTILFPAVHDTLDFALHAARVRREAQIRAVQEFEVSKDGEKVRQLIKHSMLKRQYHTIKILFDKGVDFLNTPRSDPMMNLFIEAGLVSLVREIGDLEVERQFP